VTHSIPASRTSLLLQAGRYEGGSSIWVDAASNDQPIVEREDLDEVHLGLGNGSV